MNRFHPGAAGPAKIQKDGRGPFEKTPIDLPPPMRAHLPEETKTFSRYGTPKALIEADLAKMAKESRPDLIMVTSLMTYWASGVAETIDTIKHYLPEYLWCWGEFTPPSARTMPGATPGRTG